MSYLWRAGAILCLLGSSLVSSALAKEQAAAVRPYWLDVNYSGKHLGNTGFVGQSKSWTLGEAQQVQALNEACKAASQLAAQFFSVRVQSEVKSQLNVAGSQYFSRFEQSSTLQTDIELEGVSRADTYIESNVAHQTQVAFCLVELTPQQISQTRQRLKQQQQEIDALSAKTIDEIAAGDFDRARLTLAQLKTRKVNPAFVTELQTLLREQEKKTVRVDLTLGKSRFTTGEYLTFLLASNQNVYSYVFLEGGKTTRLLFPSPHSSFNLLPGGEAVTYPLQPQIKHSEAYRIPKLNQGSLRLRLVAASEPQPVHFIAKSFNGYFVNNTAAFQQYIASCTLDELCQTKLYDVPLAGGSDAFEVAGFSMQLDGKKSTRYRTLFTHLLKKQGIQTTSHGHQLLVDIHVAVKHSSQLNADIYVISGRLYSVQSDTRQRLSQGRVTALYNEDKLPMLIERLCQKLLHGVAR